VGLRYKVGREGKEEILVEMKCIEKRTGGEEKAGFTLHDRLPL